MAGLKSENMLNNIEEKVRQLYGWINTHTFNSAKILRIVIFRYSESNAAQAAAGMAYYAFFSLFPLLLFLIVAASYVLEIQSAYDYIIESVYVVLPTAQNLIDANLQQVLNSRGAVGFIGLVGFLWSSSSFFSILAKNINRANPNSRPRNFFEDRALAIIMIAFLAILLGLSFLSTTITGFLPSLDLFYWRGIPLHETNLWRYLIKTIPFMVTLFLLVGLYRYIPRKKTKWIGVLIAALISAAGWQTITKLFTWLLQQGLVRYELVYGSLGTVVALMFWLYLISSITLLGAHLSAVIDLMEPLPQFQSSKTSQ